MLPAFQKPTLRPLSQLNPVMKPLLPHQSPDLLARSRSDHNWGLTPVKLGASPQTRIKTNPKATPKAKPALAGRGRRSRAQEQELDRLLGRDRSRDARGLELCSGLVRSRTQKFEQKIAESERVREDMKFLKTCNKKTNDRGRQPPGRNSSHVSVTVRKKASMSNSSTSEHSNISGFSHNSSNSTTGFNVLPVTGSSANPATGSCYPTSSSMTLSSNSNQQFSPIDEEVAAVMGMTGSASGSGSNNNNPPSSRGSGESDRSAGNVRGKPFVTIITSR